MQNRPFYTNQEEINSILGKIRHSCKHSPRPAGRFLGVSLFEFNADCVYLADPKLLCSDNLLPLLQLPAPNLRPLNGWMYCKRVWNPTGRHYLILSHQDTCAHAEQWKAKLQVFLQNRRKLTLSTEKTLIHRCPKKPHQQPSERNDSVLPMLYVGKSRHAQVHPQIAVNC